MLLLDEVDFIIVNELTRLYRPINGSFLEGHINHLLRENQEGYFDEKILCLSRQAYVEMLNRIAPESVSATKTPGTPRLRGDDPGKIVEAVKFYINDNIHKQLRSSEVCQHIGMSINYLNRLLKQQVGRSIGQMIIERELFIACNLLDNTNR